MRLAHAVLAAIALLFLYGFVKLVASGVVPTGLIVLLAIGALFLF